ncbi:MAG TPA: cache domain-containing protein [Candidatus Brocadiaceae bacterium]|nr:cache domain-containing protein [Candidatus Brocadiaceae bacterium]
MFKPTKSKLSIFFLVLTFLPLIVMRLVVYPITFQALKDQIIKNLEGAVQKQTELITKWMEERTADAQRIANNLLVPLVIQSIAGGTEHTDLLNNLEAIQYFDYLWKEYGSKEVFIADREGIVRIASRKELVGTNISTKDYFSSSIKGFFFTSNIIPSDVPVENESGMLETGVPTMLISSPIKDRSNSVVGTVTLRIDVSEINTMMQNIHIGKTGETYLINGYGYILTESKFVKDLKGQHRIIKRSALELKVANPLTNVATKGVSECLKGSEGFDADGYSDYRGVNVIGFWRWMPDYGWGVIAEIDVGEGYGKLYELRDYILFTFGLVAVGVIIVAFFLGKKISAPISHITETAKIIARGSYHVRAHYKSGDEIGELASAINTMAETLESRSQMPESTNPTKSQGEI